jgi:hypothetical protein
VVMGSICWGFKVPTRVEGGDLCLQEASVNTGHPVLAKVLGGWADVAFIISTEWGACCVSNVSVRSETETRQVAKGATVVDGPMVLANQEVPSQEDEGWKISTV